MLIIRVAVVDDMADAVGVTDHVDGAAIVAYFTAPLGDVDDVSGDVGGEADDALVD